LQASSDANVPFNKDSLIEADSVKKEPTKTNVDGLNKVRQISLLS